MYETSRGTVVQFPDENYAREILQLFTIGLYKLNLDGTVMRGKDKEPILTYSNKDIEEYSRVWTGFTPRITRGNIEFQYPRNGIDPMGVDHRIRDKFPKVRMNGRLLLIMQQQLYRYLLDTYILLLLLLRPRYSNRLQSISFFSFFLY